MLFLGQGADRNRPAGTSAGRRSGTGAVFTSAPAERGQRIWSKGSSGRRGGGSGDRSRSGRCGRGCRHRCDGGSDTWAAPGKKGTKASRSTTAASAGTATTTGPSGSSTATRHTQGHIQQGFFRMSRGKGLYGEVGGRRCSLVCVLCLGVRAHFAIATYAQPRFHLFRYSMICREPGEGGSELDEPGTSNSPLNIRKSRRFLGAGNPRHHEAEMLLCILWAEVELPSSIPFD